MPLSEFLDITNPYSPEGAKSPLGPFYLALNVAFALKDWDVFWNGILQYTNDQIPPTALQVVKIYAETKLMGTTPAGVLAELNPSLLGADATWSSLGFVSISDDTVGVPISKIQPITIQVLTEAAWKYLGEVLKAVQPLIPT